MNKNTTVLFLILLLGIGVVVFYTSKNGSLKFSNPVVLDPVSDTTKDKSKDMAVDLNPVPASDEANDVCYFKQTKGDGDMDSTFVSINYSRDGKVHGVMNIIPAGKDSLVGTYSGTVEKTEVKGYMNKLNIIYSALGDGDTSKQQEIILVGPTYIKTGSGEKALNQSTGVFMLKDLNKLTYSDSIYIVNCSTVESRFKADYSKATQ